MFSMCDVVQDIADSEAFGWEARGCASSLASKAARIIADSAYESSSAPLSRQSSAASSAQDTAMADAAGLSQQRNDDSAKQAEARKAKAKARQVRERVCASARVTCVHVCMCVCIAHAFVEASGGC